MSKQGNCMTCTHCWEDVGTSARECDISERRTEEEIVTYYEDMKDGCPHYEEWRE